jgi:hypothetical protein
MSAPQFTPGPWQWVGDDEIEQAEYPFTSVAEVVRIFKDEERAQCNANARLIAAAPRLYSALAALVEANIKRGPFDEPLGSSEQVAEINEAVAAICEARGEQS